MAPPRPDRLRTTFVGPLVPGEKGRLAVRWSGEAGTAELDAWVDFDGDRAWSDDWEQIVAGAPLTEGVEVLEFPLGRRHRRHGLCVGGV
ncbi:MAG: hypothetical protein GY842_24370 [bacterium]|nr:hypothetical protein [bacterium]